MTALHPHIAAELRARMDEDQRLRLLPTAERTPEYLDQLHALDADNTAALSRILSQLGWPGIALVGEEGATAAWLLAQHADADPAFQRRALDLLVAAVDAGDADPAHLALLTDRCLVSEGRPQVYGSQYVRDADGQWCMRPVEDPEHLDARRAAVGLEPQAENEARLRSMYDE
ncbi:DUF6624 domain-containing protein [Streptomyces bluensis]|uniref:DUF6624 domain-containing protein n=1 Tax=Streptomyces bluensis TaxID=33897 RepID=UPI0019B2E584|nr:DUF6624 domain-containing protein [Streptomyces bluensis]GGZ70355.1 hypothetical protein GCM10010344_41670 [Streptomyces bluensis]